MTQPFTVPRLWCCECRSCVSAATFSGFCSAPSSISLTLWFLLRRPLPFFPNTPSFFPHPTLASDPCYLVCGEDLPHVPKDWAPLATRPQTPPPYPKADIPPHMLTLCQRGPTMQNLLEPALFMFRPLCLLQGCLPPRFL